MKTVLVIGASRGLGLEALRQGLEAGHMMRALARSADAISIDHANLTKYPVTALDAAAVAEAVCGADVVISALGIAPSFKPVTLFSKASHILVDAMQQASVKRLICVTGIGVGTSNGVGGGLFTGFFQPFFLEKIHEDKNLEEEIVQASGLDWTIVRPGFLTRFPKTGRYKVLVQPETWEGGFVTRADVADFLIRLVEEDGYVGQTPLIIS